MVATKRLSFICYGITFIVFLVILLWGTLGPITGNELAYSLLSFYMIMPITSLIMGLLLGLKNAYLKWIYPMVFGFFSYLIPFMVFGNLWLDWVSLFFSLIPALLGLIIGFSIHLLFQKVSRFHVSRRERER